MCGFPGSHEMKKVSNEGLSSSDNTSCLNVSVGSPSMVLENVSMVLLFVEHNFTLCTGFSRWAWEHQSVPTWCRTFFSPGHPQTLVATWLSVFVPGSKVRPMSRFLQSVSYKFDAKFNSKCCFVSLYWTLCILCTVINMKLNTDVHYPTYYNYLLKPSLKIG